MYAAGSCRAVDQRRAVRSSAVCTRSSACPRSPVSRYAVRSSRSDVSRTNASNASRSARVITWGSVSSRPPELRDTPAGCHDLDDFPALRRTSWLASPHAPFAPSPPATALAVALPALATDHGLRGHTQPSRCRQGDAEGPAGRLRGGPEGSTSPGRPSQPARASARSGSRSPCSAATGRAAGRTSPPPGPASRAGTPSRSRSPRAARPRSG